MAMGWVGFGPQGFRVYASGIYGNYALTGFQRCFGPGAAYTQQPQLRVLWGLRSAIAMAKGRVPLVHLPSPYWKKDRLEQNRAAGTFHSSESLTRP